MSIYLNNGSDIENTKEVKKQQQCISSYFSLKLNIVLCLSSVIMLGTKVNAVTQDGICKSKDIRNQPSELMSLSNCRVIEGFLMITLIESHNDTDYDNITFPDLIEITDFLMLYRVQGLKTLAHLFPNLRVIRGNSLVNNYALIIYEMLQLQEIGLKSLTTIIRGSVRIEKNPLLCFVDTVNWLYIANGTIAQEHFIDSNKNSNECPVCPLGKKGEPDENDNSIDIACPTSKQDLKKRYCWNRSFCQKICPDSCGGRSCDDELNCCDESCLGSCEPTDPKNCTVCRNLSVGPLDNRKCVDTCPQSPKKLYMFEKRRCVTDIECWNNSKPFATLGDNSIPHNGTCSLTCPKYHRASGPSGGRICIPCNGECKRECHGSTIDSIAAAQNYRGCSIITGTLIIRIRQGEKNIIKELEQSLSDIEEIEGGLKVLRSYPLISLNFLKKLKVIHGINAQGNYALYVMNNQNLQSLFDRKVIIAHGKIFFHFNSKLCYATIEKLKPDVYDLRDVEKIDVKDVATNSNGDKVSCNITKLLARPSIITSVGAVIEVEAMKYDDDRVLLGYELYYKPAQYQNVSLFENRDACGGDSWQVEDATDFDRKASRIQIVLFNLKPFTQYVFYIKTFTIESEQYGGQTELRYFRTLPEKPGIVQKMNLIPNGSSSIIVTWKPPKAPNGQLTNYIVKASLFYDYPELLQQRNYCLEPLGQLDHKDLVKTTVFRQIQKSNDRLCSSSSESDDNQNAEQLKEIQNLFSSMRTHLVTGEEDDGDNHPLANKESETLEQNINFEIVIQNIVYVKRTLVVIGEETSNDRRTIVPTGKYSKQTNTILLDPEDVFPTSQRTVEKEKPTNDFTESKLINGTFSTYYEEFYDNTTNASTHSFTLNQLRHFSTYSITVQACRDFQDPNFNVNTFCSNVVMLNRRTDKIVNANDIDPKYFKYSKLSYSNNSLTTVKLNWPEPKDPNGLVVSYTVIYRRVDLDNVKPTEQCITRYMHANLSGEIPLLQLSNGNYSVSVRATSLAGDGEPTPPIYICIGERNTTMPVIITIIGIILLLGVIAYVVRLFLRRKSKFTVSGVKAASICSSPINKEVVPLV